MRDFLPIGSVVTLKDDPDHKLFIVQRAVGKKTGFFGRVKYYDYCGVNYPLGVDGLGGANFQRDEIGHVYFKGYDNEANKESIRRINEGLRAHGIMGDEK